MSELFISTLRPPEDVSKSDYLIDVELYSSAIRQKWKSAKVVTPPGGTYVLEWELNEEHSLGLLGGLQSDRRTVSFGINYFDNALDYILWHREYVPNDVVLYLFDANLDLIHRLTTETSRDELILLIQAIS
ncbi:MAG: hypothetical protein KJ065_17010 [Anaerolineae bacterium]|nr:hypothetical protein [Anaerolineae bacterium]